MPEHNRPIHYTPLSGVEIMIGNPISPHMTVRRIEGNSYVVIGVSNSEQEICVGHCDALALAQILEVFARTGQLPDYSWCQENGYDFFRELNKGR